MKRWLSGLLAAAMLFSLTPAALAADGDSTEIEYTESAQLEFLFPLETTDGSEIRRSDVDVHVTSSSFLDAYERKVDVVGGVLSVTVTVDPSEVLAVREKTGYVKVSLRLPRNYERVETQTQSVTVTYPEMDLDGFEDALYDMRGYGTKEETFSPNTLALPAKAISLMKRYLKADSTMTLEYDDFNLVFVGRYVKSMDAKTIGTNPKTDASTSLSSLLTANKLSKSRMKFLRFGAGEIGGQLGVQVHTGSKKNYVYQYNSLHKELTPIDSTTENGYVTFFVRNLGEFVISPTEIDVDNLVAPKTTLSSGSSTGAKLTLKGTGSKRLTISSSSSTSGKRLVLR